MARLLFDRIDVLVLEEIGGRERPGFDPNVITATRSIGGGTEPA
jgi:hypothetical protein